MCADDSSYHTSKNGSRIKKTLPELEQNLEADADKVSDWCTHNRMNANATKSHAYKNMAKRSPFSQKCKEH